MRHVPCSNHLTGETGICTFNWSCVNVAHGVHIGHCVDRFFIGTCCKIPKEDELKQKNTSTDRITESHKKGSEMVSPISIFHILATAIKKQEASFTQINNTDYSTKDLNQSTASLSDIPHSYGSNPSLNKGYYDYSFVSNHNRKPILHDTSFHTISTHILTPSYDFSDSTERYSIENDKVRPDNNVGTSSYQDEITLSLVLLQNKTWFSDAYDKRKPVSSDSTHDQRKQTIQPVIVDISHDQRKPVSVHETLDQRKPVISDTQHDIRKPVPLNEDHDQRWPVLNEDTHDERLPMDDTFNGSLGFPGTENNSIPLDDLLFINKETKTSTSSVDRTSLQDNFSNITKVCGRPMSTTTGRIVGGRKSHHLRWPWMISLQRYEEKTFKHKCGATLLNQFWAATAAHCVDGKLPQDLMLRLGEYNFQRSDRLHPYIERRVYVLVVHPDFNPSTYESDLALLRFEDPVEYQANIVPVCLPPVLTDITGRIAVVTGWGKLAEEGELPSSLHEVYVPIISNKECEKMYLEAGYTEAIKDVFVCAGVPHGGLDACEGDSGGPMVIRGDKGQWILVGLISWGISCAAPKQPGVYTRISEFNDWINEIIIH